MAKARKKASSFIEALSLFGREEELRRISACVDSQRSVVLEGPVGVGKTHLVLAATHVLGRPVFRIDGDNRYTEQKLTGWFDPPTVMKKGFVAAAFIEGPLVSAMRAGGILFINELNRLPEGVQNVLLPALDEKMLSVPKIGVIRASEGFLVIATQNPKEFVATSHLSEALLDRFELITIDYQTEAEENAIVYERLSKVRKLTSGADLLAKAAVRLIRATRNHPRVRRGASVRAALAIGDLTASFMRTGSDFESAFISAAQMALPTRMEMDRDSGAENALHSLTLDLVSNLAKDAMANLNSPVDEKKKN